MPLFVVRHSHQAERCPAQDPYMGAMLLNHLSRPNVRRHGVEDPGRGRRAGRAHVVLHRGSRRRGQPARVHAAVPDGRQRGRLPGLDLRPRRGQRRLRRAAAPCPRSRPRWTRKRPASTRSSRPGRPPRAPAQLRDVDPGAGGRRRDADRAVLRAEPFPRCPSSTPPPSASRRRPGGSAAQPQPARPPEHARRRRWWSPWSAPATGERMFDPPVDGEKWNLGAVSTAEWTGVPLVEMLDRAGVRAGRDARCCFRGADGGEVDEKPGQDQFRAQSLARRGAGVRRAAGLRDERRATADPARLSAAARRARLVRRGVGEVADRDRGERPAVRRLLPDRALLCTTGAATASEVREPVTLQRVRALITEPGPGAGGLSRASWSSAAWPGPARRRSRAWR